MVSVAMSMVNSRSKTEFKSCERCRDSNRKISIAFAEGRSLHRSRVLRIPLVLACLAFVGLSGHGPLQPAGVQALLLKDVLSTGQLQAPMHTRQVMETGLAVVRHADGTLGLAEVAEELKRPLRLVFYDDFDASNPPQFRDFILETIMPAAANLMGRFVRVRSSSILLNVHVAPGFL